MQLLDAAVDAIRDVGAGASMEQLARRGGVTKPILYRHFGDRNGLVGAIAERYGQQLLVRLSSTLTVDDPRTLLRDTVDGYLAFLEEDPELYTFLLLQVPRALSQRSPEELAEHASLIDVIGRQVAVVIGERFRALGLDDRGAEPMAFGIVGMVHSAGHWWIRSRSMSRAALTEHLTTLLWSGFDGMSAPESATSSAPAADATPS